MIRAGQRKREKLNMACLGLGGKSSKKEYKSIDTQNQLFLEVTLKLPDNPTIVLCNKEGKYLPEKSDPNRKKKKQG